MIIEKKSQAIVVIVRKAMGLFRESQVTDKD